MATRQGDEYVFEVMLRISTFTYVAIGGISEGASTCGM